MTLDERHAAFCAGLDIGMALRCDLDTAGSWSRGRACRCPAHRHRGVADVNRRGSGHPKALEELRTVRQIEGCERSKTEAMRWPLEAGEVK
jgi:hypothetical protein